ncbi:CoA pyrophosphatase [Conexibacter sp. JD483]|uniref:NUDIX hydrolase n=1 Tax=unclassified Conexibacter TaxID=2627773 RepID=UPI002723E832|nr:MULTISPECIES: CoA pyrophosphatase [unclassified Conexibacter]MDO8187538.1 CoA pyrophosphatase [Conexibacter sp. CPCC 205706]MDO8199219.1 CoA pyrophosphatase [Conexibacter sp. CPCC 205762]MDR9369576.1 CoA pyrophosphatase [Conexibacter sp. JD483]
MTTAIADELRRRLAGDEASANVDLAHETEAAVLVPLFLVGEELHAVFTKRREDMRRHPGEISFPGGRRDHEREPLQTTALREAEEEVGLTPASVELVGTLAPVRTFVTGYVIYPHVGLIPRPDTDWVVSENEVAQVMELPLKALVAGFDKRPVTRRGMTWSTDSYVVGDHFIWGATARILGDLLERIGPLGSA